MIECKKCKGKSGYIYTSSVEYASFFKWNGDIEFSEETGNTSEKKLVECRDCGCKIKM